MAGGTGDFDFSFSFGYPDFGFAAGTGEIAIILSALEPGPELGKPEILFIAAAGVPGKNPNKAENQRDVGQKGENPQIGQAAQNIQCQTEEAQKPAETVNAISAHHKIAEAVTDFTKHNKYHLDVFEVIILNKWLLHKVEKPMFKDCLRIQQFFGEGTSSRVMALRKFCPSVSDP